MANRAVTDCRRICRPTLEAGKRFPEHRSTTLMYFAVSHRSFKPLQADKTFTAILPGLAVNWMDCLKRFAQKCPHQPILWLGTQHFEDFLYMSTPNAWGLTISSRRAYRRVSWAHRQFR